MKQIMSKGAHQVLSAEAATLLDVKTRMVNWWINHGHLTGRKVTGVQRPFWLIDTDSVIALALERHRTGAKSKRTGRPPRPRRVEIDDLTIGKETP